MDIYTVIYEEMEDGDLYGISIVDKPANEKMFLTLSEQKHIKLQTVDSVKKICTGIVLMPDQKIYREFEDGTPFLLQFDAQTIERFSQDYFKKGYQKNTRYNHDASQWLEGNCIIESWIVEDPANDKLNALGFEGFPKGTWAVSMKLSDQAWSDYIMTGKANGFSIDSFVRMEKINLNTTKMKKTSFLSKLVNLFVEGNVTLIDIDSSIGMLTADALELGNIVYDETMQPVINAEFNFEGMTYSTDETGAISEISTIEAEPETEVEVEIELPVEDVVLETTPGEEEGMVMPSEPTEEEKALEEKIALLQSEIDKLKEEKSQLTEDNKKVTAELLTLKAKEISVKLGAQPRSAKEKQNETALEAISRISTTKINN